MSNFSGQFTEAGVSTETARGREFDIMLAGTFQGTVIADVQLSDGTWTEVKDSSETTAVCKTLKFADVQTLRLNCSAYTSGTIDYEVRGVEFRDRF